MDREDKPDREGYLGFRKAVDDFGNKALAQRAVNEWHYNSPANSVLAQYYDLFLVERAINKHYIPSHRQEIAASASKRLPEIRNTDLRHKVSSRIERLTTGWAGAKLTARGHYEDLLPSVLKFHVTLRQSQHPQETEGQAWFQVKRDVDHHQLSYLDQLKERYEHAVDKQLSRALGSEAKTRASAALDLSRKLTAFKNAHSTNISKDHDRER